MTINVVPMTTSASLPAESASEASVGGSVTDRLVEANQRYAAQFSDPGMDARPVLKVAVVACMDARLDLHKALGLELGDCHTIRNAGGVVTDDTIRSLTISQRALGTRTVILIHHTGCGLENLTEDFRHELEDEVGQHPPGPSRPSGTSTRTSASPCSGFARTPSCPTRTMCEASSSMCTPGSCGRSIPALE